MNTNRTVVACLLALSLCAQNVFAFFAQQPSANVRVVTLDRIEASPNSLFQGRIYDPQTGRFLSADIVVQTPSSLQSYNRYSYVGNNPLSFTDPTGYYSVFGLEFTDGGGVGGFFSDLGGYTVDATTGAAGGLYDSTVGAAVNAGNEAGQMYIDSRELGSGGLASFGYATSMGLGRMSGGMGLVEFYSGTKIETGSDGSLKPGEFSSVSSWVAHGAASYVQAGTTAVGIKSLAVRVAEAAPKTGPVPEVNPTTAPMTEGGAAGTPKGGAHGDVKGVAGNESHHMPADSASPLPREKGPAISMKKVDHQQTASWGSSKEAKTYRAAQKSLIDKGDFKGAQQMDIKDVRAKFGEQYEQHLKELEEYTEKLKKEKKI